MLPLLAVVYLLSPVDLIPDVVPIIGWLDDVGVLTLVIGMVVRSMRRREGSVPRSVDTVGSEV